MTLNATAARAIDHAATRAEREAAELRQYVAEHEARLADARADLARVEATVRELRNPVHMNRTEEDR